MPDISHIDTGKVEAAAKQMEDILTRITGCVTKFGDALQRLDKGWVSEAKDSFYEHVQTDTEALQEMMSQLLEVSTGMLDAAQDFAETENEIGAGVKALR